MSPLVSKRPAAQRDLLEHFVTLGERAGEATTLRFLQAAEDTFAELAAMPHMGRGRVGRERGRLSRLFSRPPSEPDVRLAPHPALQFPMFLACGLSFAPVLDAGEERVGSPPRASLDVLASRTPAALGRWAALRPVSPVFPASDSSGSSVA